jgi:hypothetical protein
VTTKTNSKSIATKTASVTHQLLAQTTSVTDPLPTKSAPSPPKGYVPIKIGRGARPQRSQVAIASKAANELRGDASYAEQFGSAAPDRAAVADALTDAAAWSATLQNAAAWYQYVKQQESVAWKHAFGLTDPLRVPFEFRLTRDATIGQELPSVAKFFAASKETAQKAVATKKRKASEAAAAAKKAVVAATPATSEVIAPATAAAAKLLN